jgi:hypothetical protein
VTAAPRTEREIVQLAPPALDNGARWRPVEGSEIRMLLDYLRLGGENGARVKEEALRILSRCVPATAPNGEETGLVIGYVQSGKTMSFTAVAALARDNGYRLVIVITGTSKPLFEQSKARLLRDLQIQTRQDRKWKLLPNPSPRGAARTVIQDTLDAWNDAVVPEGERQTVLLTVMKNATHLRNLNSVLGQLELEGMPALVIDDEADQAGLNNLVRERNQSTTYGHLLGIKQQLPHHSFLQYTATPQAPLLINLIDVLSPSFAELVTPGPDYIGGKEFFINHPELVRTIPDDDIPDRGTAPIAPPESLLTAMKLFFLGVAAGLVTSGGIGNRSMLVHPSQETLRHNVFFRWVRDAKTHWQTALALPEDHPDRRDVVAEFETAYTDLAATVADLPPFQALLARLLHAMRQTREEEVNARAGQTPLINWHDQYGHILVGGQAMDRGFTVVGLTVTYMPRAIGVGNADTVQQRARFFGYKRGYLGYCRVFLETAAADAYRRYVTHEEDIRSQLARHRDTGRPLREWKREFLLTPSLRPCRDSVLGLPYMRFNFGGDWYVPRVPHHEASVTDGNRELVRRFIDWERPTPNDGDDRRTEMQRHLVRFGLPLRGVFENLLMQYRLTNPGDSARYTSLLLQLQQYQEENPGATCTVYVMNRGVNPGASRMRPVNAANELTSYIFQGEGRAARGSIYPGDRNLPAPDPVHIQIHHLRLERDGEVIQDDVPTLAIFVPPMPDSVVVQDQGGP